MKKLSFLACTGAFLLNFSLYADESALKDFNRFYQSGQYLKAIGAMEHVNETDSPHGQKYYLIGLSYSKLQEYDKAISNFELAIKGHNANADLYYEYGQALYAANELKAARKAFKKSAENKFNTPASIYYVAHISQIVEEFEEAKINYTALIKNKEADVKIKQVARFQLAETLLLMMRDKVKGKELEKGVDKYIITMLKQAVNADKNSAIAGEINARIKELQKEFGLDPDLLRNGRRISSKRYSGYVSQKIKFDDNISLTNEENNVSQSKKESYIFESEVYGKYDFVLKKKVIVSPEARVNFVQHSDQDSTDVYQNDAVSLYLNLKNKFEHKVNNQPASFLLNFEYSNIRKDWQQGHRKDAYAQSFTVGIGEAFNYYSFGDTSFKMKRKSYNAVNDDLNNHTFSFSADQTASLPNTHLLIAMIEVSMVDNYNNKATNTTSFLTRFDYLISEIMPKYTLGLALSSTITDTKDQVATRGTEFTLNPSADLSKEINKKLKISVNYDFTKSNSKSPDYKYQKNVFSTELRYSF
ncbi:MAG: tetratricopeptide repeat protein [Bacteriovorax sp.]